MGKLPNFLIVGAAKSGTTALYRYLEEHPGIYMSPVKEPRFITSNFLNFPFQGVGDEKVEAKIIKDWDSYYRLFSNAKEENCIGEASTDTLYYYKNSIPFIKKYFGDVKIIIVLRNPVERAFSAFTHMLRDGREHLSFEQALQQEEIRKRENWEFIWYYKDAGFYYNQVKAFLDNFSNVKVCLFDDLKKNPVKFVQDIYRFLKVDHSFVPTTIGMRFNMSGIPKSIILQRFFTHPNFFKDTVRVLIPKKLRLKIRTTLLKKNLKKPEIKPETKEYLKRLYKDDILKLQELLNVNLASWL